MHESKPVASPMSNTSTFTLHDGAARFDPSRYRTVLGKLQYLSFTRPDISYSVNKLSQFMHDPSVLHWAALKRVLRYLRGTSTLGLVLSTNNDFTLSMFSDADWAGDVDGRNSTSGHILFLGKNPISWSSKKQQTVARSSTEAEFKAVANAASEVCWVQNLLHELRIYASAKPIIYCDNDGVQYLSNNPTINTRMKHVAVDFHFWTFACHHVVYLINRMPTPILNYKSPYEKLFCKQPDYESLKCFGCLCYPWIRPYTKHKLEPRSTPCVYLGVSLTHHCNLCYDPVQNKLYLSRDVVFIENEFPYRHKFAHLQRGQSSMSWEVLDTANTVTPPTGSNPPSDLPLPLTIRETLTKPLSKSLFCSNLSKLGVVSNYKLEGGV